MYQCNRGEGGATGDRQDKGGTPQGVFNPTDAQYEVVTVLQFTFPFSSLASTQPHLILSSPRNHLTTPPSRHLVTSPPHRLATLSPHHRLVTSLPQPHLNLALALVSSHPHPCLTPIFILDLNLVSSSSHLLSPNTPEYSLS